MFTNLKTYALVILFLLAAHGVVPAQEVIETISLDDGTGPPDFAFGMNMSPDGTSLYVAICGYWNDNNNRIVQIDTVTDSLAGGAVTELYPEEIAIKVDEYGEMDLIFVSNNSSSSITVLGPDLWHVKTISLGAPGTIWPFGLFIEPGGRYLYATTQNAGEIFVIDTDYGSNYLEVVDTYYVGAWNGRFTLYDGQLIIPGSDPISGAMLHVMDLGNPGSVDSVILDGNISGWLPSANDLVVSDDGYAYVPIHDFNGSSDLFEVDLKLSPPVITRTIDMSLEGPAFSWEHGICASEDFNTLIVTYFEDTYIKMVGRKVGRVLKAFDANPTDFGMINEARFSADGKKLYLTDQGLPLVYVLAGVPEHGLLLDGTQELLPGEDVDLMMGGGESGMPGILLLSLNLGPIVRPAFTLEIGPPLWVLYGSFFDGQNKLYAPTIHCPNDPGLSGLILYLQGLTQDADQEYRPSNLHIVTVQ